MENKSISARPSREKRDPGFVKIRRGLLAHLPGMSSNAAKLYLWFHLKAFWQPPKRGRVEASFDDMARGNGWSLKTLQRTIEELETIPFIEVERATNQYELTRIRILKYDLEEFTSALDKSVQSDTAGVDYAEVSGVDKFDCSTVHSKPASQQHQHDLQAPKKVKEVKELKNGTADAAVRRPFDGKLPLSEQRGFSPSEKKKKLTAPRQGDLSKSGFLPEIHRKRDIEGTRASIWRRGTPGIHCHW